MLRAHAGVVEPGRYGMGLLDLAVAVLQDKRLGAMQHTHRAFGYGGGMLSGFDPLAPGFHTDHLDIVRQERVEKAHGIAAPAHTCHQGIGK